MSVVSPCTSEGISHDRLPLVAVIYDRGSAGPAEIISAAAGVCRVVFVCDYELPEVAHQRRLLAAAGDVLDITGRDMPAVALELRAAGVRGLLTLSEPRLVQTAELAELTGLPFHSRETVLRCTNKARQRDALAVAGLDHVRYGVLAAGDDLLPVLSDVGLPAVIKPLIGLGSRNTAGVASVTEARAAVDALREVDADGPVIVEELLVGDASCAGDEWGDYVSVEALVAGDEIRTVCVTGKFPLAEPFRETGVVVPSTLGPTDVRTAAELAAAAVRALDIRHGVTHTELKLTKAGPRIIEVNARVGGYVPQLLRRSTGYDLIRAALRLALGDLPEVPVLDYRSVEFEYFLQPPTDVTEVVALSGLREARAVDGVLRIDRPVSPGAKLDWRDGTTAHVLIAHCSAATHADALSIAQSIRGTVHVTYA
jgi:ATP-grasp domain-containing protein